MRISESRSRQTTPTTRCRPTALEGAADRDSFTIGQERSDKPLTKAECDLQLRGPSTYTVVVKVKDGKTDGSSTKATSRSLWSRDDGEHPDARRRADGNGDRRIRTAPRTRASNVTWIHREPTAERTGPITEYDITVVQVAASKIAPTTLQTISCAKTGDAESNEVLRRGETQSPAGGRYQYQVQVRATNDEGTSPDWSAR